ncbi:hypothetical protein A9K55_002128 [Cordyceps militaris]|uniref:Uncharacterized protein n=1 Tax=Cordyceps militaris TaxID=73501 RepID=A0A2H4SSS3_CORMI|nr:hypothetical protein A9K55_002128 [Cordyceps militaris]
MGLPLFVAPVESDVARKAAPKNRSTSPSRTSIRRADRPSERERQRNVVRRAAARIYGPVQRTLGTRDPQERPLPWIESDAASDYTRMDLRERPSPSLDGRSPDDTHRSVLNRQRLEEQRLEEHVEEAQRSQRHRQYMEEHMSSVFGTSWHDLPYGPPAAADNQDTDLGWWSIDPQGRGRRPRMMTPISSRFTRSPDAMVAARARTSSPLATEAMSQAAQNSRQRRIRVSHLARDASPPRRTPGNLYRTFADGLGDRERSLSPDGWDTLHTTLAPDPQPPSTNTSFASGTDVQSANQSATQTSRAQPAASWPSAAQPTAVQPSSGGSILPDGFDDAPIDTGCDSACEHSDIDEGDNVAAGFRAAYRSRTEPRSQNSTIARYARSANRMREGPPGFARLGASSIAERQALNGVPIPDTSSRNSGASRASMGAGGQEDTNLARNARMMAFSPVAAPAEEDWSGMQHIMRSLAQREDIPEEWWAEAGLSRTLSQQGTN